MEKRTALALLVFRMDRLAMVTSTCSESWLRDIFRFASMTSRFTGAQGADVAGRYRSLLYSLSDAGRYRAAGLDGRPSVAEAYECLAPVGGGCVDRSFAPARHVSPLGSSTVRSSIGTAADTARSARTPHF